MEPERFDELAASVAEGEASRRSVVLRLGGGGLAALLAALGFGGDEDDAEARRRRGPKGGRKPRKPRKKRRKRRRGGGGPGGPGAPQSPPGSFFDIDNNIDIDLLGAICTPGGNECGNANETGLTCVGLICVPIDVADEVLCEDGSDCDSGRCGPAGLCISCPVLSICENDSICCVVDAECDEQTDLCVLQTQ